MENLQEIIAQFSEQTGYELKVKDNHLYHGGYLDLRGTGITSLPEGLTVGGSLDLEGCTGITSLPEGLTVGGYLYLRGTGITSLPEGLTVGGSLDLRGTGITSLPEGLTVGGNLDLRGTGITSLPEGLTVGGYLDLEGCTGITSLPEGLTVGGYLDLRGTGITDKSKVIQTISLEVRKRIDNARRATNLLQWDWSGRRYIKIDGIFAVLDSCKGNLYLTHQIGKTETMYIVTDGEGHYAHGSTMQEAKSDLIYKINDRDTSAYKKLTLDDELTFEEAIAAYRTITGACSAGTRDYIENRLPKPYKEKYTVREILQLTKGEYKSEIFEKFFCNE